MYYADDVSNVLRKVEYVEHRREDKVRRKNLGLSQESLAERLHVSRQTISSWENGKSAIKLENAKPLSDELKIPLDEF